MNIIIFSLIVIVIAICIIFMLYIIRNKSVLPRNNDIGTAGIVEHFAQYGEMTAAFFKQKLDKIINKDILLNSLNNYDEILLVGSGKGVVSIKNIKSIKWKRKSLKFYKKLFKLYKKEISNCPFYK